MKSKPNQIDLSQAKLHITKPNQTKLNLTKLNQAKLNLTKLNQSKLNLTNVNQAKLNLKGQSNEIFDLQFFSSFEPAWATDQGVKIFLILVKFSLSFLNFYESHRGMILRSQSPRGIIPRQVK